jgi:phosphomannomutase
MIKICDYPCNNKREAELEEDRYMMELKANMNSHRASRTKQQYQEDNKEKLQKYFKKYRENNKDHYKEYEKQRQEQRQEYMKEYRENNKEKIQENMKEIVKCECGCEVTKSTLKRHQRTQKHMDLMKCM